MMEEGKVQAEELTGLIEESAEDLYEHAPCGYISTLPNGIIVRVNTTFLNWLGYTREELLNKKRLQDVLTIGSRIYYETHFAPLLHMQGFINEVQLDAQTTQKHQLPFLVNIVQLKSEAGKPLLNRSTFFNITDRKKYEKELLQARKKAEEAAKVKAEFLSTVSHEIRTPLNAIIGISNLLADSELNQKQQELINILHFSAENLLHLINDILDFSKIEAGKMALKEQPVNLRELIYSTLYSLSVKAEAKGLQLRAQLDELLPDYLFADPVKITQVLTNLVGNAIKFTAEGTVTVEVEVLQQIADKVELKIAVTDTGIGITEEQLPRIFEEFTQASYDINAQFGGTGLGLTISRKLLQLYRSDLKVESAPGKGSVFYFTVQLRLAPVPAEAKKAAPGVAAGNANSLAGIKLLLAEDNEVNVFVIAQFFAKWGVAFDVAENGAVAVEMVQQNEYDLVLMDLQMPVLDGYEATKAIRALPHTRFRTLPVVALSASSKFDLEEKLKTYELTDFVGKPFDPATLHSLIAHYGAPAAPSSTELTTERAVIQPARQACRLDKYLLLTEGDPKARQELFTLTIRDLRAYRQSLLDCLEHCNEEEFAFQVHKSKMILQMLQASDALAALQHARELLANPPARAEQRSSAAHQIQTTLDALVRELQQALER